MTAVVLPAEPDGTAISPEDFEALLSRYKRIKRRYVDPRLAFYRERVDRKRRAAQAASIATLLLSLAIPLVAQSDQRIGLIAVSAMALLIAFITGVSELCRWQTTWKEYSRGIVQIETLMGAWEIRVEEARELTTAEAVSAALGAATEALVESVNQAVSTEMEQFFRPLPAKKPAEGEQ